MKTYSYLFLFISVISFASMNPVKAQKLNLLIGTYTDKGTSEGIYVYEFNTQTGTAVYKNKVTGTENPSYLAISHDEKYVYAANEAGAGEVSSFAFDKKSGTLELLNKKPSNGTAPCYIATNTKGNFVFAGNYGAGNFSVYPVSSNGSLGDVVQVIQHTGSGVNKERQEGPHVHSTVLSPDEKFLMVSNLGTDKISIYRFDPSNASKPLTPADPAYVEVKPGNGPRHLDFHPNGKFAYSIQEMRGNITVFAYSNGHMKTVQDISLLPEGFKGAVGAADIHVSPDGNFLYASNRGEANDIAIFSIDKTSGLLKPAGRTSTLGNGPRNFVIDPSGNFLLVGNQNSDSVIVFKRDKKTGLLSDTGERIKVGAPVCLKFASI